jgi:hypothetical protein
MRERLDLLLTKPTLLPILDPRPRANIRNTVLTLALAREVLSLDARIAPTELDLQHLVDAQRLVVEARDGEGDGFWGEATEEVSVALVGGAAAVPEEEPLEGLAALEVVLEAEGEGGVVMVGEIDEDGRGLEDGEGRRLVVVDEDGDAAVGVEA